MDIHQLESSGFLVWSLDLKCKHHHQCVRKADSWLLAQTSWSRGRPRSLGFSKSSGCFCRILKLSRTKFGSAGPLSFMSYLREEVPSSTCSTTDCSGFVTDWMSRQQVQKMMIEPRRALLFHFTLLRPELTPLSGSSFSSSLRYVIPWTLADAINSYITMETSCPKW